MWYCWWRGSTMCSDTSLSPFRGCLFRMLQWNFQVAKPNFDGRATVSISNSVWLYYHSKLTSCESQVVKSWKTGSEVTYILKKCSKITFLFHDLKGTTFIFFKGSWYGWTFSFLGQIFKYATIWVINLHQSEWNFKCQDVWPGPRRKLLSSRFALYVRSQRQGFTNEHGERILSIMPQWLVENYVGSRKISSRGGSGLKSMMQRLSSRV